MVKLEEGLVMGTGAASGSVARAALLRLWVVFGLLLVVVLAALMVFAVGAFAVPDKLLFAEQFGREVNLTQVNLQAGPALEDICTALSEDICQAGKQSGVAGGFRYPYSVAVVPASSPKVPGNVYVTDNNNNRVQEFTASGVFVLMFGWDVDMTKVQEREAQEAKKELVTITQQEENVCTAASKDTCQAGQSGTGLAGQISEPQDVAVDPATGNVYVVEEFYKRVEEFTPEGAFVLMIGGDVDKTKVEAGGTEAEKNVCTAVSKDTCQVGEFAPHAFKNYLRQNAGDLLVVGGPEGLLYVGDEQRVQEFRTDGEWVREVSLISISAAPGSEVQALAVASNGDLYVVDHLVSSPTLARVVHEFDASGVQIGECAFAAEVTALALDPFGRLAVKEAGLTHGVLYGASCSVLGTFAPPGGMGVTTGFAFNSSGELYAGDDDHQDVEIYEPATVAELVLDPAKSVTAGEATLVGLVNPEGSKSGDALVWFECRASGGAPFDTPVQVAGDGTTVVKVEALLTGLLPNEVYKCFLRGEDRHNHAPEPPLTSGEEGFPTLPVPPVIGGEPHTYFVTSSGAILAASLDPENAETEYLFEYAPESACPSLSSCAGVLRTAISKASAYKVLDVTRAVAGLAASTTYRYRLFATSEPIDKDKQEVVGAEGSFTTPASPHPIAVTGAPVGVGATGATLTGTVDPDGAGATYSFQTGIDRGSGTVYGTVVSGPAGAGTEPESEQFALTDLQPGTEYSYRVVVSSAYGTSIGAAAVFRTAGLPSVVESPLPVAMLTIPQIEFPTIPAAPKPLTTAQKLANALKACSKKPRKQRASCERAAHKKYPTNKKTKK